MTTTTGGFSLTHAMLTKPPVHIPNRDGFPFKTELVLERDPAVRTHKIVWWHADDDRGDPHNHPWDFESTIRAGGYTEERWWFEDSDVKYLRIEYRAGDRNLVGRNVFHRVTNVLPGTVTEMICGPAFDGNEWGYLDPVAGIYTAAAPDPGFLARLHANNRFLAPR